MWTPVDFDPRALLIVSTVPSHCSDFRDPPEATALWSCIDLQQMCGSAFSLPFIPHMIIEMGILCNRPVTGREPFSCMRTFSRSVLVTLAFSCLWRDPGVITTSCLYSLPRSYHSKMVWQSSKDSVPCGAGPWKPG